MLVVPLRGDNITNGEGINQTVKQYTGIKKKPACYVVGIKEPTYFEDIKQLKKLPVELHNGCFKVYGLIKRLYHLPQPGEYVSIYKNGNLTIATFFNLILIFFFLLQSFSGFHCTLY